MPSVLPFCPNKLAYPGTSVLPGVDPTHPAFGTKFATFSGVATGAGSFTNVVSGVKGTNGGDSSSNYAGLGPVANYLNTGANTTSSIFTFAHSAFVLTLGAIFKIDAVPLTTGYILNDNAAGGIGIGDIGPTGHLWVAGLNQSNDTGFAYVLGRPYFFAASLGTAFPSYWVIKDLVTGKVLSASFSDTAGATGDGTFTVGSRGTASRQMNGGVAAAMASSIFLSQQQLLQWAENPWSFWYPQRIDLAEMLNVAPTVGVPLAAGLLQTRNGAGLGPRSRHTKLLNAALPTPVAVVTVTGGTLPFMGVG